MPIVTLSTDIGQKDFIVGAIKGQIVSGIPDANICDISHQLSPQNYFQVAYVCSNAFRFFPKNTFHIIIVNLFDKVIDHMLLAKWNDQYIVCPDNGLLMMITGEKPEEIIRLEIEPAPYITALHCTSYIVRAYVALLQGASLHTIGNPVEDLVEKITLRPTTGSDWIEGQIIFIDNFENIVVNIKRAEFEANRKGRNFKIIFTRNDHVQKISTNYAAVPQGEILAWFNSAEHLEIAINNGNLAGLFGLTGFTQNRQALQEKLMFQTRVRIEFD